MIEMIRGPSTATEKPEVENQKTLRVQRPVWSLQVNDVKRTNECKCQ